VGKFLEYQMSTARFASEGKKRVMKMRKELLKKAFFGLAKRYK